MSLKKTEMPKDYKTDKLLTTTFSIGNAVCVFVEFLVELFNPSSLTRQSMF